MILKIRKIGKLCIVMLVMAVLSYSCSDKNKKEDDVIGTCTAASKIQRAIRINCIGFTDVTNRATNCCDPLCQDVSLRDLFGVFCKLIYLSDPKFLRVNTRGN